MSDLPVQRADATQEHVGDPILDAQAVIDDPSKKGTPEWMAAVQLLVEDSKGRTGSVQFAELEREMQMLRGMSEI